MSQTTYDIRLRDAAFIPQAALTDFIDLDLIPRMNEVGAFTLTVRADSPALPYFVKGGGIIVTRDLGDGAGARYLFSGPFWHLERNGVDNTYILAGPSDEWWLKARLAYPTGGYPFMEAALKAGGGPARYYRLGDAVSTSAPADASLNNKPASVVGTVTFGQTGLVAGDPETSVNFTASPLGRVFGDVTGLNIGNAAWTYALGVKIAGAPAGTQVIGFYGNPTLTNLQGARLQINTSRQILADAEGATLITGPAIAAGSSHLLILRYDGAGNLSLNVDGGAKQTASAIGTLAIPASPNLVVGAGPAGATPWAGNAQEWQFWNSAISDADVAALWTAFSATHGQYDTRSGLASAVLLGYVNANLISPVNVERDLAVLTAAADPSIGSTASANARGDNLLTLLQQIASANGDIGFRIVQTGNGALQFQIYQPVDRSASVKFSNDFRNLLNYSYTLDGPVSNSTLVYGGGTGAGRTALVAQDAASIAAWGLIEGPFVDARDTSDSTVMTQRGAADINTNSQQTSASFKPIDTATTQYQRDYGLGDIISLVVDGVTISNKVREVHIAVTPQNQELVTLGVGNPGQGIIDSLFDNRKKQQALQAVADRLNRIAGAV